MPEASPTYEQVKCPTCQQTAFHLQYTEATPESRIWIFQLQAAAPAKCEAVCLRCGRHFEVPSEVVTRNHLELWRPVESLKVIA